MHAQQKTQTKPIFTFSFKRANLLHTFWSYAIIMQDKQISLQNVSQNYIFKSISFDKKQSSSYPQHSSCFECITRCSNYSTAFFDAQQNLVYGLIFSVFVLAINYASVAVDSVICANVHCNVSHTLFHLSIIYLCVARALIIETHHQCDD